MNFSVNMESIPHWMYWREEWRTWKHLTIQIVIGRESWKNLFTSLSPHSITLLYTAGKEAFYSLILSQRGLLQRHHFPKAIIILLLQQIMMKENNKERRRSDTSTKNKKWRPTMANKATWKNNHSVSGVSQNRIQLCLCLCKHVVD